ncbi:MAG: hypothetical protein DBX59_07825 [Bacillota bacterium]|nr:MAG: hypothetical protein DBX59_07825 [Bacillota bacterium]
MELFQTIMLSWILPAVVYGILVFFMSRLFPIRLKLWQLILMVLFLPTGNFPKLIWGPFSLVSGIVRVIFIPIGFVLYPLLMFRGSVWRRLAVNLSLFACQMLGEMTATSLFIGVKMTETIDISRDILPIFIPYSLITVSVDVTASYAVVFFAKALESKRFSRLYIPAFLFPLSLMGISYSSVTPVGSWIFILSILLGCGALTALMYLLGSLEEKQVLEIQLQETRHAMELEQAYYRSVEEQREKLSLIRHDFKNQLASISALLQLGEEQEARQMIGSVSQTIDDTREAVYCSIPVINAVLSGKEQRCREKGITLSVDLTLPPNLMVEPLHLCSIFGNLLDNAICGVERGKTEQPTITLRSLQEGDYLFLKVTNPSPPPQPPREGRGIGTRILHDLTQQYGGDYQTEYKDGIFTAVVCLLV